MPGLQDEVSVNERMENSPCKIYCHLSVKNREENRDEGKCPQRVCISEGGSMQKLQRVQSSKNEMNETTTGGWRPQLVTHRVLPCATGHLWFPRVFFVEKNLPHSSQRNSQIFPCFATSCRSRSCCRENRSEHPSVHGKVTLGLGLCASMCTLRVYWLVNRRLHPRMRQGNLRLSALSQSCPPMGELSLDVDDFVS